MDPVRSSVQLRTTGSALCEWPSVTYFAEATETFSFTSSHLCWFFNKENQSDPALLTCAQHNKPM